MSAVQVIHVQAAAPVIVPAAQAAVECISNQEVELSWQMQLSSLLFSLLWYLPDMRHRFLFKAKVPAVAAVLESRISRRKNWMEPSLVRRP